MLPWRGSPCLQISCWWYPTVVSPEGAIHQSAWWKFGNFSMHPLLPQPGRTSGPCGRDGADVFSFSIALTEWFWSSTAHPERCVCVCTWRHQDHRGCGREAEPRRLRASASFSRLQGLPDINMRSTNGPYLLFSWDQALLADLTPPRTCRHKQKWVCLVAGPALWCPHLSGPRIAW